ncbi:MAG TPA: hypothetical protein VHA15_06200 [Burkholderiales bacterium]|nr:hypothetical protein [Burkholderiales bacterium]
MRANREAGSAFGWVDVSDQAAGHGLDAQVCISVEAWRNAVYAVREPCDRLDPVRENWRMGRLLEEVSCAVAREDPAGRPREFTLALHEGFDRLRSLALPGARLRVRVERDNQAPEVWVDMEGARGGAALGH